VVVLLKNDVTGEQPTTPLPELLSVAAAAVPSALEVIGIR
jgi:hypothetical protein